MNLITRLLAVRRSRKSTNSCLFPFTSAWSAAYALGLTTLSSPNNWRDYSRNVPFIEPIYCTPCHRKLSLDPLQPWSNSFSCINSHRFRVAPFNFAFVFQMPQLHIIPRQNFVALFIFHFWGLSLAQRHLRVTVADRKCRLWGLHYVIIATCCTSHILSAFGFLFL